MSACSLPEREADGQQTATFRRLGGLHAERLFLVKSGTSALGSAEPDSRHSLSHICVSALSLPNVILGQALFRLASKRAAYCLERDEGCLIFLPHALCYWRGVTVRCTFPEASRKSIAASPAPVTRRINRLFPAASRSTTCDDSSVARPTNTRGVPPEFAAL